jgi:hypothetical protein
MPLQVNYIGATGKNLRATLQRFSDGKFWSEDSHAWEASPTYNHQYFSLTELSAENAGSYNGANGGNLGDAGAVMIRIHDADQGNKTIAGQEIYVWGGAEVIPTSTLDAAGVRTAVGLASANLDTQLATVASLVSAVPAAVWAVGTRTLTGFGTLVADVWAYATRVLTAGTNLTIPTANQNADALLNRAGAIAGKTPAEALRIIGATTAGVVSGAGTGTEVFKDFAGEDCVTVEVDESNNRTSVGYS